jgi:hypothetical protein
MNKFLLSLVLVVPCVFCIGADDTPPATPKKPVEMNELEKQFEKTMSGAMMIGRSSIEGNEDQVPAEDRYVISKVTKVGEDMWLFTARLGDSKVPIFIPVPVKWAGDTAVISLTKFPVPTKGTFTARVVIYADHYAGAWDGGDHRGYLWGRIERAKEADAAPAPTKKPE